MPKQLAAVNGAATLPVGATEQHGPHMGCGMDAVMADELCRAVAQITGVPMLPTLPYGCSLGHSRRWPGTLALQPVTMIELVKQIGDWAYHSGVRRLFIVNTHVTNAAPLRCALEMLRSEHDDMMVAVINAATLSARVRRFHFADADDWHANDAETSLMLAVAPHMVRAGELAHADDPDRTQGRVDGLGQAPNEDELTSVPDLTSVVQLPWQPAIAWMPADNEFKGQPYALSTRVALKNQLAAAAKLGFGMNLGIECEVFLLRKNADGSLSVPHADDKLVKPCYDVRSFVDNFSWLDKVASCINHLGWDLYSFDHEDANGQFEFDFNYADALTMCDRLTFFRFMAKHYAKEEELLATMMPKPFADKTGNGAHFNMSLYDLNSGANLFACAPSEDPRGIGLTTLGYQFIGGILKHGRALCAAFAPTVNSYKRLVRRGAMSTFSWAPVFNSYGSNNRTNSVRVPAGGGRCESRNADGAVNPYLAAALVLAAGLEGIAEGIDRGAPNEDNLYEITDAQRRARGIEFLPQTLQEAVDAFASDPLVERTLGKGLRDEFIKYKTEEWETYHLTVSAWEIERYSHMF